LVGGCKTCKKKGGDAKIGPGSGGNSKKKRE